MELVPLGPGDEPELERFLAPVADSSMFLRANLFRGGIVDRGARLQGTYVAARDPSIVAVAAHWWSGMLSVQGDLAAVGAAASEAVARTGRAVIGITGPWAQVVAVRAALGFADRKTAMNSREDLFALALADLRVPPALADGRWICRRFEEADRDELVSWQLAYESEALGATHTAEDEARERAAFDPRGDKWVLVVDGQRVARAMFNAALPDCVQIGGVYTPPAQRGRGYARAAVAGSLLDARAAGATRSILFTGEDNAAARAAYLALGYQVIGDFGLVLF
jgi:RimJ/RimL family protein N-acetyltransferase